MTRGRETRGLEGDEPELPLALAPGIPPCCATGARGNKEKVKLFFAQPRGMWKEKCAGCAQDERASKEIHPRPKTRSMDGRPRA
jgi:hypothetical protein